MTPTKTILITTEKIEFEIESCQGVSEIFDTSKENILKTAHF